MIQGAMGYPGDGKTALTVLSALELCKKYGYEPERSVGNASILVPGYRKMDNAELLEFLVWMVRRRARKYLVVLDEVDQVIPARFFKDQRQTEAVLNLWQDEKLFNAYLYTAHRGKGVDAILRWATQVMLVPRYERTGDRIVARLYNGRYKEKGTVVYEKVSRLWEPELVYDRWELVS